MLFITRFSWNITTKLQKLLKTRLGSDESGYLHACLMYFCHKTELDLCDLYISFYEHALGSLRGTYMCLLMTFSLGLLSVMRNQRRQCLRSHTDYLSPHWVKCLLNVLFTLLQPRLGSEPSIVKHKKLCSVHILWSLMDSLSHKVPRTCNILLIVMIDN